MLEGIYKIISSLEDSDLFVAMNLNESNLIVNVDNERSKKSLYHLVILVDHEGNTIDVSSDNEVSLLNYVESQAMSLVDHDMEKKDLRPVDIREGYVHERTQESND